MMNRPLALLVACCAVMSAVLASPAARAQTCENQADIAVLASPVAPWHGAPLRVVVALEQPANGELSLVAPDGSVAVTAPRRYAGIPYVWYAEVKSPAPGNWQARLTRTGCGAVAWTVAVAADKPASPGAASGSVWPVRQNWNRATENLFSAWIEKLFDAPLDQELSWPALHVGLRDASRNFLFDHLGLGEDRMKIVLRPDCADLPYFLRAYFAFKLGLPFGYSKCSRGGGGKPPQCFAWDSIQSGAPASSNLAASFGTFTRKLADAVHSGTGRTPAASNKTDYYPVPLSQETLRPGTIYADPYGHILMLTRRVPQTEGAAGVFLAVDGQPDGTVARKRFWRGNFLFAQDPALGSPGFKRFRPIVRDRSGALRPLTNQEIAKSADYGDFSLEQTKLSVEDFYDRMDDVMSPSPLDPLGAMKEAITSFEEQVRTRVNSVENGRKYQARAKGEIAMPNGATIFETIGPWEDFSTPARDLRILIALDVVTHFPDRVARRTDRYAMPAGRSASDVKAQLQDVLLQELATRKFSYPRSDGSPWTLSLKDVVDRAQALEMAYNPNDCVELRWGAPANSQEAATCRLHAPAAQRARMAQYRPWFHERRRPPRP
jgi:hypothetical protein